MDEHYNSFKNILLLQFLTFSYKGDGGWERWLVQWPIDVIFFFNIFQNFYFKFSYSGVVVNQRPWQLVLFWYFWFSIFLKLSFTFSYKGGWCSGPSGVRGNWCYSNKLADACLTLPQVVSKSPIIFGYLDLTLPQPSKMPTFSRWTRFKNSNNILHS